MDMDDMLQRNKQAKQAWAKIENALQAAANGTKTTVSPERRSIKKADDKSAVKRTVSKLHTSASQCLGLLSKSRKKYSEMETLLKELDFLRQSSKTGPSLRMLEGQKTKSKTQYL
jgi:hypothetical protein